MTATTREVGVQCLTILLGVTEVGSSFVIPRRIVRHCYVNCDGYIEVMSQIIECYTFGLCLKGLSSICTIFSWASKSLSGLSKLSCTNLMKPLICGIYGHGCWLFASSIAAVTGYSLTHQNNQMNHCTRVSWDLEKKLPSGMDNVFCKGIFSEICLRCLPWPPTPWIGCSWSRSCFPAGDVHLHCE